VKHLIPLLLSALVVVSAQAASAQEDVARAYITQGLAAASAGDTTLAFAEFERARDAAPKLADTYYQIGRLYVEISSAVETDFRDRRKAERNLLKALRLKPSDPRYLLELARLRLKQHMKVDASRLFGRALKEAEKQSDPRILAEVHFNLGYIKELWYRSIEYRRFNPLLRGPPQDQLDPTGVNGFMGVQGPIRYGNEYMEQTPAIQGSGQVTKEEMIEHYRKALRYDPKHVGASIRLMGQLLDEYRMGEYLSIARRLSAAHPERPLPYLYLGLGLHAAGREETASEAFDEALMRLPDEERAQVESLAEVMRRDDARDYLGLSDETRAEFNDRYWLLSDPLYLTVANERRLEHLSRVAYADLRFSAPEAGLRGWQTDQGIIYTRYGPPESIASFGAEPYVRGNPYAVGRRSIIWSYGVDGPVFIFRQMPGYLNARFAGDYKFIADNYRYLQPARYANIPSLPELLDLPVQLARFRGDTPDEVVVEVHAALPLEGLAQGLDLRTGQIETGMFLLNEYGETIVRRVNTETLNYAESPDVDEFRSWRLVLAPAGPLVAAVEVRDAVTWRAAAARETFTAYRFPEDSLSVSDILVADYVKPLVEDPKKRSDYEVWPNAALEYRSGEPVHIYYEIYGLQSDAEGFASYDVSIQVRVRSLTRGGGLAALIGVLADAWGFSIVGDDRLELRYSRQVKMEGRDRVTEYLSLDPQEVPAGRYEIRLRIWDNLGERMASSLRTFEVVDEE
jgi:GWxTD domain-containing protein